MVFASGFLSDFPLFFVKSVENGGSSGRSKKQRKFEDPGKK